MNEKYVKDNVFNTFGSTLIYARVRGNLSYTACRAVGNQHKRAVK